MGNKWAVFITNLCANRNDDVKNLAESMSLINVQSDLQLFISNVLIANPSKNPNNAIGPPPHHSLHYGKAHQNALSNLNKISMDSSINKKSKHSRQKSVSRSHTKNNSLSLSSYNPSLTQQQQHGRKQSASYSLSGQYDVRNELNHKMHRQASTPNSIGSFFKQKFQKQRSFQNDNNMNRREASHTISSYQNENSVIDDIIDDQKKMNSHKAKNNPKTPSMSDIDPEIPITPKITNGANNASFDESTKPNSALSMHRSTNSMKKKKLKKPSQKTRT